ncbi:MAG: GIY-YIG nuclease family protein [Candidatus Coatesbacteria bacterium]|nr:GIY-YIG nuclease family protein [Candidatus Coatesbacteria bacterium]
MNAALLHLRKTCRLGSVAKRSIRVRYDDYLPAAEIAARHMQDKHSVSLDTVLCDPDLRAEFDQIAQGISPGADGYVVRKAALGLRKTRQLRPELVQRLAESWRKQVIHFAREELEVASERVPKGPGVYVFYDSSGYLYIGETGNLQLRIRKHLDHSDSKSLARYLWQNGYKNLQLEIHVFDPDSDARLARYRRAYESDLIDSRSPRFNLRP